MAGPVDRIARMYEPQEHELRQARDALHSAANRCEIVERHDLQARCLAMCDEIAEMIRAVHRQASVPAVAPPGPLRLVPDTDRDGDPEC